jgi:hypothetical protein
MLTSARLKAAAFNGLINEDVMQQIWDISFIPLPFSDLVGSGDADNSYTEWTTDKLQAVNLANAHIDGSDTNAADDTQAGARVGNQCQISTKTVQVSSRSQASDTIGGDALAYQVMMRQRELRRDVEAIALSHQGSVADNGSSTAGKCGAFGAWLVTNTSRGAGAGANGGFAAGVVAPPVAGTGRGLTETMVRDMAESIYLQGGDPTTLMSYPKVIRKLSEYMFGASARIATLQGKTSADDGEGALVAKGSVNVFVTDFGVTLKMVPNRLQQLNTGLADVYLIDPEYVQLAYLRGYQVEPLAKTGLAEKRQMSVDWTVKVLNEAAHGVIADIDPTIAVAP